MAVPDPVIAGQPLTYTITVINNGPASARNVVITDNVTAFTTPTYSLDNINFLPWTGTYSLPGILSPGSNTIIYIRGTLSSNQCAPIPNTASVTSTIGDHVPSNNTVTILTNVLDQTNPVITNCPIARTFEGCSTADITGPVFSATSASSTYEEFSNLTNQGTASDNCGMIVTYQDVASGTCPIIVQRTWAITDPSGNSATCVQTLTINAPPKQEPVTFTEPQDLTVDACNFADQAALNSAFNTWLADVITQAAVAGGCDPQVVNDAASVTVPDLCAGGTTTVTWTVTDSASRLHLMLLSLLLHLRLLLSPNLRT